MLALAFGGGYWTAKKLGGSVNPSASLSSEPYRFTDSGGTNYQMNLPNNIVATTIGSGEGGGISLSLLHTTDDAHAFRDTGISILAVPSGGTNDELLQQLSVKEADPDSGLILLSPAARTKINGREWIKYDSGGLCADTTAETQDANFYIKVAISCGDSELFEQILKTF